jgi:glycosyltransferase involved in cell wall biosynthesis
MMAAPKIKEAQQVVRCITPAAATQKRLLVSIVVPCFNEEAAVPVFYREVAPVLTSLVDYDFELLFVDDGSTDETLTAIKGLAQANKRVGYVSFSRNFGKEAGLRAGLQAAQGDYIITMDVDLQDPPALIPTMLSCMGKPMFDEQTGAQGPVDCVATRRVNRKGEPPVRSLCSRAFYGLICRLSGLGLVSGERDFRCMSRSYVAALLAMPERNRFYKGMTSWVGFNTVWLEYPNAERKAGTTKWSFVQLARYAIDGITAFTTKPLNLATGIGVTSFVAALAAIVFLVVRYFAFGGSVPGWASIVCIILLVGGAQLLCLGIIGAYLSRLYTEVKQRPSYIVRERHSAQL